MEHDRFPAGNLFQLYVAARYISRIGHKSTWFKFYRKKFLFWIRNV